LIDKIVKRINDKEKFGELYVTNIIGNDDFYSSLSIKPLQKCKISAVKLNKKQILKIKKMLEKIIVSGRLGRDAEVKESQTGSKFSTFSIAVSRKIKGEEVTNWYEVTSNQTGGIIPYLKKGSYVTVIGDFSPSLYKKNDTCHLNLRVNADSITFAATGTKKEDGETTTTYSKPSTSTPSKKTNVPIDDVPGVDLDELNDNNSSSEEDDDLPF
jgi:single-strand DNA-binding protein